MADNGYSYLVFDDIPLERFARRDPCPPTNISGDYAVELLASGCLTEAQERELRDLLIHSTIEQTGRSLDDVVFWLDANVAAWLELWSGRA